MAMPGFLKVFGYYDDDAEKWAIDPTVQQLISSLMTIGTFVGSLAVGPFSAKCGRRYGLWAASAVNAVATAIMLGTTNLGALYFSRFILGSTRKLCSPTMLTIVRYLGRLVPVFLPSIRQRGSTCASSRHRLRRLPKSAINRLHRRSCR